jgi:hypothetical protein
MPPQGGMPQIPPFPDPPEAREPKPKVYQIKLSDAEKIRLISRIKNDMLQAKAAHLERSKRFAGYLQRWENRVDPPKKGDEDKPNHTVPLVQWSCFNKLARSLQSLLGDDADISAHATGPSDADKVHKVGCWMRSRLFDQMEITDPLIVHLFHTIIYGRSIYFRPWVRKEFDVIEGGKRSRQCYYEGPAFEPIHPDDIVVPAERGVTSIQDFSWRVRRVRWTVDELQRGDGTLFQGTSDPAFVTEAIRWAEQNGSANDWTFVSEDPVRQEQEINDNVAYDSWTQGRRAVWGWEWYGKWRPLKKQSKDGNEGDLSKRQPFEADWVVRYIPGMDRIVGVQDLLELYPKMRNRYPFGDASLIKDGKYWSAGFGKLLGDIEDEATSNSRLFTAAGELTVGPIVFFKPGAGFKPGAFEYGPGMAIPTEDPNGVKVVTVAPNMSYAVAKQQDTLSNAERVVNISDQSMGRSIERPNAPRTATGQLALIEEGNVRTYLDSTILREDMEKFLTDVWDLDCDLVPKTEPGVWFRVTEERANGLFDTSKGGAYMTPKEFGGRYDFKLKFATSTYAREAQAQKVITFYQAAVMNPLIATNPKALWAITNKFAKALGIDDFASMIPAPPDLDAPKTPDQEWTMMLEGDDTVHPNPADHDDLHLMQHQKQLQDAKQDPDADKQAIYLLIHHIIETNQQKRTKLLMQVLTNQLMQQAASETPPVVHQMIGQALGVPQQPQPGPMPPQGGLPPQQVGSSAAPQPVDGML